MELITALLKNVSVVELFGFIGAVIFFAARLENNNKSNKEMLTAELKHIINIMEINHNNLRDDISRLEKKQEESNRLKERVAMQEVLVADLQSSFHAHLAEHHSN